MKLPETQSILGICRHRSLTQTGELCSLLLSRMQTEATDTPNSCSGNARHDQTQMRRAHSSKLFVILERACQLCCCSASCTSIKNSCINPKREPKGLVVAVPLLSHDVGLGAARQMKASSVPCWEPGKAEVLQEHHSPEQHRVSAAVLGSAETPSTSCLQGAMLGQMSSKLSRQGCNISILLLFSAN